MLTIFAIPKPFQGHNEVIQNNAIQSWLALQPSPEVILFGNDEGTAEAAARFGVKHIPDVECNEYGTPLVSSIFSQAQDSASHDILCYVNADIILLSDFMTAVGKLKMPSFVIIGRRWDIDIKKPLDFGSPDWEEKLRHQLAEAGRLHGPSGLDYFIFPRGTYRNMPPFAIGRWAWDTWIAYRARQMKLPLIDATAAITAIHQNHDYAHYPDGENGVLKGPEAVRNLEIQSNRDYGFQVDYATWLLTPQGLKRALSTRHLYHRMRAVPILCPTLYFLIKPFKALEKFMRFLR